MLSKSNKSMHVIQFTAYPVLDRSYLRGLMGTICVVQEYSE